MFFIICAKYLFIVPILILGGYGLSRPRSEWKEMAFFAVPALILTYLLGKISGQFYFDPRPFVTDHFIPLIAHAADNGFPSDHTLLAAGLAAVGLYWNKRMGILLWVLAALIAVARVYVGVHHPIDVIGSAVIALIAVPGWHAFMSAAKPTPKKN
ncbi:phosphatase PAP2 family protein [Patescibacteria group bacterium]|nr:phosphatase PAP2 family protein [Patescibacteria group bacterium]